MTAETPPGHRFIAAVAEHVSPAVAGRITDAWRTWTDKPADHACEADQARALAISMATLDVATAAMQIDQLKLVTAQIHGSPATLNDTQAFRHPLLNRWAAPTFSAAIADCIGVGRYDMTMARETPVFSSFELIESDDAIQRAIVRLAFQKYNEEFVGVDLEFGRPATQGFSRVNVVDGISVMNCGVAMIGDSLRSSSKDLLDTSAAPVGLQTIQ